MSADGLEVILRLQVMSKRYDEVTQLLGKPEEVEVASDPELGPLSKWREVFMTCEVSWHLGQRARPRTDFVVVVLPCKTKCSHTAHAQQVHDAWKALGGWVTEHKPNFGPVTVEYFKGASEVTDEEVGHHQAITE